MYEKFWKQNVVIKSKQHCWYTWTSIISLLPTNLLISATSPQCEQSQLNKTNNRVEWNRAEINVWEINCLRTCSSVWHNRDLQLVNNQNLVTGLFALMAESCVRKLLSRFRKIICILNSSCKQWKINWNWETLIN